MKIVLGQSTLVAGLACFGALTAWGQVTAVHSLASDPRTGNVYVGIDSGAAQAGPAAVVMNPGADHSWTASIEGAASINALAVNPAGDAVFAAGSKSSGAGFVVRLNAADGGVLARVDLDTAVLALAVGADGAIYSGGNLVRKMSPQLVQIFSSDPGGVAVGLAADPADGALYAAINAGGQAFAAKLSPDGSTWLYRIAAGPTTAAGIAYDGQAIYLTGSTTSLDFPVKNAAQDWRDGISDAFVAKFGASDGGVMWSTYLGGRGADGGTAIAMGDDASRLVVAGWTTSPDFPGAGAGQWHGGEDGFVTEMDAATGQPLESQLIGTALDERVQALSVSGAQISVAGTAGVATLAATTSKIPSSAKPAAVKPKDTTTAPTFLFPQISYQSFGTPPLTLSATAGGKIVSTGYSSLTKSVCTVSGRTATLIAIGVCTVQASLSGYTPMPITLAQSFSVTNGMIVSLAVAGATPQTTNTGSPYPQALAVIVKDTGGNPVLSANITFTAPASGASGVFSNGSNTISIWTSASGIASAPFTANATGGSYTVMGTGASLAAPFALTNAIGKITPNAGTTPQVVNLSSTLGTALGVTVTVANVPLPGTPVTFTAPSSGASGTFSNGTATITVTTGANGVAAASFTSNSTAGSYNVTASAPGLSTSFGLTNSATVTSATLASARQHANVGAKFANPLGVMVLKPNPIGGKLNGVPGVSVTFTAPSAGASGLFSNQSTTITVVTDSTGTASAPFTANSTAGAYLVTATSPNLAPVYFFLANAGAAAFVHHVNGTTPQITNINTAFPTGLAATVVDQFGTPVTGAGVTFTAPASGPSGKFSDGTASITIPTALSGIATAPFIANGSGGPGYFVTAAVVGANTAQFSLMNAGIPVSMTVVPGSTTQSQQIGESPPIPLAVAILDGFGNPVPNIAVTVTVPASGPSLRLAQPTVAGGNTTVVMTSSQGIATPNVSAANSSIGSYTVAASATSLAPVQFYLTNLVGGVCYLLPTDGTYAEQTTLGTPFAPLTLLAADCGHNPVPNAPVTFTAPSSGPSAIFSNGSNVMTLVTNASGIVSATMTANMTGGREYNVVAVVPFVYDGVIDTFIAFSYYISNAGPPANMYCEGGCYGTADAGAFFDPIQIKVEDAWGTLIGGINVTMTVIPSQYDTNSPPASAYFQINGTEQFSSSKVMLITSGIESPDWGFATFNATPNCTFGNFPYSMVATAGAASSGYLGGYTNTALSPWYATCIIPQQ